MNREILLWSGSELRMLRRLSSPDKVQTYLDALLYRCESVYVPPVLSVREGRAHCMDGALVGASALLRAGYPTYLIDLCAHDDDDHVLCAYKVRGYWGAVAKSNFPGLRFREPIFRTVRELVLSYFESYFNLKGRKSIRRYSSPLRLPSLKSLEWEGSYDGVEEVVARLERARHFNLITKSMEEGLRRVDPRFFESQMVGVDFRGAYGGSKHKG